MMAESGADHILAGGAGQVEFDVVLDGPLAPEREGPGPHRRPVEFGDEGVADAHGRGQVPDQRLEERGAEALRRPLHDSAQGGDLIVLHRFIPGVGGEGTVVPARVVHGFATARWRCPEIPARTSPPGLDPIADAGRLPAGRSTRNAGPIPLHSEAIRNASAGRPDFAQGVTGTGPIGSGPAAPGPDQQGGSGFRTGPILSGFLRNEVEVSDRGVASSNPVADGRVPRRGRGRENRPRRDMTSARKTITCVRQSC